MHENDISVENDWDGQNCMPTVGSSFVKKRILISAAHTSWKAIKPETA